MASMTIRNIEDRLEERLRLRAAARGHSIEDEAHDILRTALVTDTSQPDDLSRAIRARLAPLGGVDLTIAPREPIRPPTDLDR